MEKNYCPYCGRLLTENCTCEQEAQEEGENIREYIEERQHKSGLYTFLDRMEEFHRIREG